MVVTIQIPPPMRDQAGGQSEVNVAGTTVQTALDDLVKRHPLLGPKLFDNGRIRQYVNVFVNDEDIRYLDEIDTKLADGAVVALIPAVAGG